MKLTKLQRHTAYIIMLYELDNAKYTVDMFLCNIWNNMTGKEMIHHASKGDYDHMDKTLPELYRKRPSRAYYAWFAVNIAGVNKRRTFLKNCIKETY